MEDKATEMEKLARKARNEYAKAWRAKNPDKAKATMLRYWAKKALEAEKEQQTAEDGVSR